MKTVLITGGAGLIGRHLRQELAGRYAFRVADLVKPTLAKGERAVNCDVSDAKAVARAMRGVDAVVHLAGVTREGPMDAIMKNSVIGTANVYEAARKAGVGRVIYASSNHAMGFYRRDQRIGHDATPRPDGRYGLSKVWGEALGALYADKHGIRTLAIRIGNANDKPIDKRRLSIWVSWRDLAQLVAIGIEHPAIHFNVVYGVSDNERAWYDNDAAFRLGYRPQDRAEDHAAEALAHEARNPEGKISRRFMGGEFCAMEYSGDLKRSGRR